MKKENSKTGLVVLVVILSILVVGLTSYIVYDKFVKEDEEVKENPKNDLVENESQNKVINYQKIIGDEYIGTDGNYGIIERENIEYIPNYHTGEEAKISIQLGMTGKVIIYNISTNEKLPLNTDNVIDMVVITDGIANLYKLYLLTGDGNVYTYNLFDLFDNNTMTNKVEISDYVNRIIKYSYATFPEGRTVAFAYTENNELIEIK